jgi:serine-type D-Ala-D-Ala carboxypeptidase
MLLRAFDHQDEIFSDAFSILNKAIVQRAFPSASIAVTHQGRLVAFKAFGHFTYEREAGAPSLSRSSRQEPALSDSERSEKESKGGDFECPITTTTLFDLASVTKVVATTTMAMILDERGLLELDAPVAGTIPQFLADFCGELDARRRNVTFRMLLAHSSGLPAYEKLFLQHGTRDELLRAAFTTSLSADPGSRAEYSDIGFIILGAALDHIAGEPLDIFCQREIFAPLAMANTAFNPAADLRNKIPPTADDCTFRHRIIQGEVQDENASVLGGVAGHAGLFSTAEDVSKFAHAILECGAGAPAREMPKSSEMPTTSKPSGRQFADKPILRSETVALFTRRQSAPEGTSRALGWDTPSTPSQSGKYFGPASYGHLGYTGTSLWIDPDRQLSITLLTNRTWPDCSNQAIKQVRPAFHDAIVEALDKLR